MDTIFALATAVGKAGVAVIRVSGPEAPIGCKSLCGQLPEPRRAGLRTIRTPDGAILDQGLVIFFPSGGSFTGEPVVEFQTHGSIAVVRSVLKVLENLEGFRPAEAGEFTRRALANNRLDLTQVEGLADLIEAETELQREQAQEILSGALSNKIGFWRQSLIETAALLEASLDFSDEDVPIDVIPEVKARLGSLLADLRNEMVSYSVAERIRDGFEVAIMGPPNTGKSTLLNAIARRSVALTSDIPGTTRDVLEVRVDLNGLPVTLLDTAGLRSTDDPLEAAGIALAKQRAEAADIRVWLSSHSDMDWPMAPDIVVHAKDDDGRLGGVSGLTGQGIENLLGKVETLLVARLPKSRIVVRERHRDAILRSVGHLENADRISAEGQADELIANELRSASAALAEIVGGIDVEDLLEDIFARFCIGK